jgi:phosphotriesterase-related protein
MKAFAHLLLLFSLTSYSIQAQQGTIMTVNGPIPSSEMGLSLIHEHVLVDFIGAEETGKHRWDENEVIAVVQPFLDEIKALGVRTLVECTPAYLGRDVQLLKRLSAKSGVQIITNTGYYGASDNKYLPPQAYSESAEQLASRWIKEAKEGIDGTGIRPGFIKTGVNGESLSALHAKLIKAAAKTHLETGLVIASHTGPAVPAFEQMAILEKEGVDAGAFIWVHAQGEPDLDMHVKAAKKGAWISLDGLDNSNLEQYLRMLRNLKEQGFLHRTLLSHDAGWYSPDEDNGGEFRDYTVLLKDFIPLLTQQGWTQKEIQQILVINPRNAFEIKVQRISSEQSKK